MNFARYHICHPVRYRSVQYDDFQVVDSRTLSKRTRLAKRVVTGIPDEQTAQRLADQMNRAEDPDGLTYIR